ncbi:MAG TPA: hypothetical protein VGS96_22755 [Thermoanaerobaculia bacterium]|jgi:hypothetical protein|nr:hypothetical protein [Thermoanaerobaculia bacterium]
MKRNVMGGVAALLLTGHAAFAAVQYEYFQTSRSELQDEKSSDFNARAVIDGSRSRVEFISGNTYPPGTYVISTDAARKLLFVDPTQKTYTEVNSLAIASAVGTSNITIGDLLSSVTKLDDAKVIAGIPTDHYRLTMTYNITINFRNMALKQSVRTTIDKWTTVRFGDAAEAAFSNTIQTGNAKVDELIAAETTKIRGFPLRQTIQVVTINETGPQPVGTKLALPASRTMSREMTVTAIGEAKADDSLFRIPAEYRKIDFADQINKSQTQVLTPPSNQ